MGEGPERSVLEALIHSYGLSGRASLPEYQTCFSIPSSIRSFCSSITSEGFPNALTEAMACGVPVIATRCGGAIEEIVHDGENGILVSPMM